MGQMSAVLTHEIRNPLGIIRGTADVLKSRYEKSENADPLFHYIPDEVNRLNKLVNNFLVLSKDSEINLTKQDINQLIEDTVDKLKIDIKNDAIKFKIIKSELLPFYFDHDGIQQVLINLMRNAIQAIEKKGEISIKTEFIKKKKNQIVQTTISDNGAGIEGNVQAIFEPFFTTKSSGSGLGMAVSRKIVEGHSGWVDIESQVRKGTKVMFTLPYLNSLEE